MRSITAVIALQLRDLVAHHLENIRLGRQLRNIEGAGERTLPAARIESAHPGAVPSCVRKGERKRAPHPYIGNSHDLVPKEAERL